MKQGGSVTGKILTAIVVVLLLGGAFYSGFAWQQQKIDDLRTEKTSLQDKFNSLSKQTQTQSNNQAITSTQTYTSPKGVKIKVYYPLSGATVSSPVAIVGEVPGNWSFEASFPIQLKDSKGTVVAKGTAQLLGNWMTDQLVPFSAKLTYTTTEPRQGTLILTKDNPSGLDANNDSISIPVKL